MDEDALYDLLTRLEFKNFIKRLGLSGEQAAPRLPEVKAQRIGTAAAGVCPARRADRGRPRVCRGARDAARALPVGWGHGHPCCLRTILQETTGTTMLRRLFDGSIELVLHDAKPAAAALLARGIQPEGIGFDTCIAAYLIDPTQSGYDLPRVALAYCNTELPALDLDDPAAVSPLGGQEQTDGGLRAACGAVRAIYTEAADKIEQLGMRKLYYEIELPLMRVLAEMEALGCAVAPDELRAFGDKLDARIRVLVEQIYEDAGGEFNINSTRQLGEVLFEKLGSARAEKDQDRVFHQCGGAGKARGHAPDHPRILEYRQLTKLKSTYVEGLLKVISPKDGRIHTHFQQTVTATGRLSSTDPNLQNIPVRTELGRELRRMFVAPDDDHVLIDADYSQIELRVLAHISQDEHMIEAFRSGKDIHAATAAKVYHVPLEEVTPQMRSSCKAVNFGIVYGISDFSLAQDIGVTRKEAGEFIRTYLATYPGVAKYMDDIKAAAKENGYVTTLFGRRRALPELQSRNFNIRSFGERVAMNTPIQGTAADIIKIAMVRVRDRLLREGLESRLILQVHDELILEAPKSEQETAMHLLKEEMEAAFPMDAPLVAEAKAGHSWYETK